MLILKKSADDKNEEKNFPACKELMDFVVMALKFCCLGLLPKEIHNSQGYCMLSLLEILLLFRMLLC